MRHLAFSALASVVLVAACQPPRENTVSEERFCADYAARECGVVAPQCNASVADCQPVRVAACMARIAAWKSPAFGSRVYRPDNVKTCLDKVGETYGKIGVKGAALDELDRVCARVFQGSAKANEPCQQDLDCDVGLSCDGTKLRCGQPKQVSAGGGCANIGEYCPSSEYCKASAGTYFCTKRQAKGQPCSASEPCLESLHCAATCVDKLASGAGCAGHDQCVDGYCSPYSGRCGAALTFAEGADSCRGFLSGVGAPADGGASPSADAGTDGP